MSEHYDHYHFARAQLYASNNKICSTIPPIIEPPPQIDFVCTPTSIHAVLMLLFPDPQPTYPSPSPSFSAKFDPDAQVLQAEVGCNQIYLEDTSELIGYNVEDICDESVYEG